MVSEIIVVDHSENIIISDDFKNCSINLTEIMTETLNSVSLLGIIYSKVITMPQNNLIRGLVSLSLYYKSNKKEF